MMACVNYSSSTSRRSFSLTQLEHGADCSVVLGEPNPGLHGRLHLQPSAALFERRDHADLFLHYPMKKCKSYQSISQAADQEVDSEFVCVSAPDNAVVGGGVYSPSHIHASECCDQCCQGTIVATPERAASTNTEYSSASGASSPHFRRRHQTGSVATLAPSPLRTAMPASRATPEDPAYAEDSTTATSAFPGAPQLTGQWDTLPRRYLSPPMKPSGIADLPPHQEATPASHDTSCRMVLQPPTSGAFASNEDTGAAPAARSHRREQSDISHLTVAATGAGRASAPNDHPALPAACDVPQQAFRSSDRPSDNSGHSCASAEALWAVVNASVAEASLLSGALHSSDDNPLAIAYAAGMFANVVGSDAVSALPAIRTRISGPAPVVPTSPHGCSRHQTSTQEPRAYDQPPVPGPEQLLSQSMAAPAYGVALPQPPALAAIADRAAQPSQLNYRHTHYPSSHRDPDPDHLHRHFSYSHVQQQSQQPYAHVTSSHSPDSPLGRTGFRGQAVLQEQQLNRALMGYHSHQPAYHDSHSHPQEAAHGPVHALPHHATSRQGDARLSRDLPEQPQPEPHTGHANGHGHGHSAHNASLAQQYLHHHQSMQHLQPQHYPLTHTRSRGSLQPASANSYTTYGYRRARSSLAALDVPAEEGAARCAGACGCNANGDDSSSDDDTEEATRRLTAAFRTAAGMSTRSSAWGLLGADSTPSTPTSCRNHEGGGGETWSRTNSGVGMVTGGPLGTDGVHESEDSALTRKRSSYHLTASHAAVELFLRLNHARQTMEFVKRQTTLFAALDKAELGVWEALGLLNELREYEAVLMAEGGEAQEVAELSLLDHAFQTAELCRLHFPDLDWLHLVGLIHGLGKLLAHRMFGSQPQWAICGETYPLGCRFSHQILGHQYFTANPDRRRRAYNTPTGIYAPGCGLAAVVMSWSAPEYLYLVMRLNQAPLPEDALFILRHCKFASLTRPGSCYVPLCCADDERRLPLLAAFQQLAAYRRQELPEGFALQGQERQAYYTALINKYIGEERLHW